MEAPGGERTVRKRISAGRTWALRRLATALGHEIRDVATHTGDLSQPVSGSDRTKRSVRAGRKTVADAWRHGLVHAGDLHFRSRRVGCHRVSPG